MSCKSIQRTLAELGIQQNDESRLVANLGVSGQRFGALARCVSLVELTFNAALSKDNIVTSNQTVRQAVDKLGVFPITLYSNGMFGVQPQIESASGDPSQVSKKAVLGMIDDLVENLKKKRM